MYQIGEFIVKAANGVCEVKDLADGVAFVNDFLKKIEDDGTWTELWQICIGDRTGDTNVPELPEIGA